MQMRNFGTLLFVSYIIDNACIHFKENALGDEKQNLCLQFSSLFEWV